MGLSVQIVKQLRDLVLAVEFSCGPGQLVALVGPSGAGKTTILRIVAGLEHPDKGRITLDQEVWVDSSQGRYLRTQMRGLAFVFQHYPLFPHLTLWENCCFAASDKGFVKAMMSQWGIAHLKERYPHEVSGGERQRAAIVQALARHPKVLLMDEPFSALDQGTKQCLRDDFVGFKSLLKIPVVMVTHDLGEAQYLADKVLFISRGRCEPFGYFPLKTQESCANVNSETFRGGNDGSKGLKSPHPSKAPKRQHGLLPYLWGLCEWMPSIGPRRA